MGLYTKILGTFAPERALRRMAAHDRIRAYEAARPSRTHTAKKERHSANVAVFAAGKSLREQARWLDENHDLASGMLDKLEERVVGARGIQVEPHPLNLQGEVHEVFAAQIAVAWEKWAQSPEVTGMFSLAEAERLMLRSALRDGEVFTQLVRGPVKGIEYTTPVQFAFEMLEADFVPMTLTGMENDSTTIQGINVNAWGRPTAYHVYLAHPQSGLGTTRTKVIGKERMLHLAMRKRLHQLRGITIFANVIQRLGDLKDYEESERVAARIAAMLGFWIKRGDSSVYEDGSSDWESPEQKYRSFDMSAGMIYDGLAPGEEMNMLESNRPNSNMAEFRNGQLRAAAAGTRTGYSSISRDYNGTYSSQRQELVESFEGYAVLQDWFVARIARPLYREWLRMYLLTGVKVPSGLDMESLYNATYMAPVMPWIDPVKEGEAWKTQIRGGAATEAEWVRARGGSPRNTKLQRQREVKYNQEHHLVFDTDPANDKGTTTNEQTANAAGGTKGKQPNQSDE